jgi:hypothetical protein
MKSHTYDFAGRDLAELLGWPLLPVIGFAVLIHCGAALHLLPRPRPALDVDRTLLVHQVEAARVPQEAQVLLLGDSSCLMDVSARQLSEQLGRPALNLGTHSYLDLKAFADLLRQSAAANPGKARAVVLLLNPEALRRMAPEPYHVALLQNLLRGEDSRTSGGVRDELLRLLGLEAFRDRILCRLLPTPLPGAYGRAYGFSSELDVSLTRNLGSAVDPDPRSFQGNPEYRLAPQLEAASRAFRAAVPVGVTLLVGITPVPAGFTGRNYQITRDRMLQQWAQWLQADVVLEQLPATLPDDQFTKVTHLNEAGVRSYTGTLARLLKPHLP